MFDPHGKVECFGAIVHEDTVAKWKTKLDQDQVIGQAELFPVLVSKLTWASSLRGRKVIFFVDNEAARLGLVKAYSPVLPSLALIMDCMQWDYFHQVSSWYARVPTACNVADKPSRFDCRVAELSHGAVVVKPVCPSGYFLDRVCS